MLVLIPLWFLFIHDSVLANHVFPGIYPFLLDCPVCWYVIVHSCFLCFCFSDASCNVSFFISYFKGLSFLLLFWKKKTLLISLIFFSPLLFSSLYFIYFCNNLFFEGNEFYLAAGILKIYSSSAKMFLRQFH